MMFGCLVSLSILYGVAASTDNLTFSIWKTDTDRSHEGILMVSVNEASRGNICRYFGCPTINSATNICQRLDFHDLAKVATTTSAYDTEYSFRTDHPSNMYELYCTTNSTCTYASNSSCFGTQDYTYILSCNCKDGSYASSDGCVSCPAGSKDLPGFVDRCDCPGGLYWLDGQCAACPEDTFSEGNATSCTQCPDSSRSDAGSGRCTCPAGRYLNQEVCKECPTGSDGYFDRCACAEGLYWSDEHCIPCPKYTFSGYNAVNCTPCPDGSRSVVGSGHCSCPGGLYMDQGVCKNCPVNHFSTFGSTSCTRCPDDATETADQSSCSCPAGTFWDTDNCAVQLDDKGNSVNGYLKANTTLLVIVMCMVAFVTMSLALVWLKYRRMAASGEKVVFSTVQENPVAAAKSGDEGKKEEARGHTYDITEP